MKCVVQRIKSGKVYVEGKVVGQVGAGLLCLCGFLEDDTPQKIDWMANKIPNMRIFTDENDKLNLSVKNIGGEILVVSNFTLYGDAHHGNRPNFSRSAKGEISKPMYDYFVKKLGEQIPVQTGIFGAHMELDLYSDGPITIVIEKE